MEEQRKQHIVIVTFPMQSHLNPALEFARRLFSTGDRVTLVTSISGNQHAEQANLPDEVRIATFFDGASGECHTLAGDPVAYMSNFQKHGSKMVREVFEKSREVGKQVTCLVYTQIIPWVATVARECHVPSVLLWIQPALVFDVYYYYFRGYGDVIKECESNPTWLLKLPNLPFTLTTHDLPSILLPSTLPSQSFGVNKFLEQVEEIEKDEKAMVLVNTFEALEVDALKAINGLKLIPVGPLLPFGSPNKHHKNEDYMKWLDSQGESKVIYVSFGTLATLSTAQLEEVAHALIQTKRPFLWVVMRENTNNGEMLCRMEELKQLGKIVPWCSQIEVLAHPSVGCFVTHCGWNSTLESITSGVPMVAFPQRIDQATNAKLVEDVWKIGCRVKRSEEEGLVKDEEIKRCLEAVMGSEAIKENVKKWKELAVQAAKQDGDSDKYVKHFIAGISVKQDGNLDRNNLKDSMTEISANQEGEGLYKGPCFTSITKFETACQVD